MSLLLQRLRRGWGYGRQNGLAALWREALHQARKGGLLGRRDVAREYGFMRRRPVGAPIARGSVPAATLNWFIPRFARGAGGHLNIFRFVHHLEEQGFDCRLVIVGGASVSAERARAQIAEWFFPLEAPVYLGAEDAPPAHACIATSWPTAYAVRDFLPTLHRCYFVQDFEPWFFPAGAEYAFAEQTYRLGLTGITAGAWLAGKLAAEYGMAAHPVGFSYDRERYRPLPRAPRAARSVFFYARPATPRRAFELGLLVLQEVTRRLPDVKVVLAGGDLSEFHIPFEHTNAGVLPLEALPGLYNQCDAALVLSFSNASLLPLELMACGTPVVSNRAPCTEWLLNDANAKLAAPDVESLAAALVEVLESPQEQARLREGGFASVRDSDWRREAARMADILRALDAAPARA